MHNLPSVFFYQVAALQSQHPFTLYFKNTHYGMDVSCLTKCLVSLKHSVDHCILFTEAVILRLRINHLPF